MLEQLSEDDKEILRREATHRWHQPWTLYSLVILCSMAAAVQGVCCYFSHQSTGLPHPCPCYLQMDETVVNGAQLFFPQQFGISTDPAVTGSVSKANRNEWILGLVTGAPYVRPRHLGKGNEFNVVSPRGFTALLRCSRMLDDRTCESCCLHCPI